MAQSTTAPSVGEATKQSFAAAVVSDIDDLYPEIVAIDDTDSPFTAPTENSVIRIDSSSGAITINLPAAADWVGLKLTFHLHTAGNDVTINPDGSETYSDGTSSRTLSSAGDIIRLESDGTNILVVSKGSSVGSAGALAVDTSEVTVTNTTTETTIFSFTVPANTLGTENVILIKIIANSDTDSAIDKTLRLKYGSSTVASRTGSGGGSDDDLILEAILAGGGTTSSQHGAAGGSGFGVGQGESAEDSTNPLTLSLTWQWASAGPGLIFTKFYAIAYVVEA